MQSAANIVSLSEYRQSRVEKLVQSNSAQIPADQLLVVWVPVWFMPVGPVMPSVQTKP